MGRLVLLWRLAARDLRRQGIGTEISSHSIKLKKAMGIASKLQVRYTIIIGEQEVAAESYQLKDMRTGEQQSVSAAEIVDVIKKKLGEPAPVESSAAGEPLTER